MVEVPVYVNLDDLVEAEPAKLKNESMTRYEEILKGLVPGKVYIEAATEGQSIRGLLLRFSKTAKRLGIQNKVNVTRYNYKGEIYAGVVLKNSNSTPNTTNPTHKG